MTVIWENSKIYVPKKFVRVRYLSRSDNDVQSSSMYNRIPEIMELRYILQQIANYK